MANSTTTAAFPIPDTGQLSAMAGSGRIPGLQLHMAQRGCVFKFYIERTHYRVQITIHILKTTLKSYNCECIISKFVVHCMECAIQRQVHKLSSGRICPLVKTTHHTLTMWHDTQYDRPA